MFATQGLQGMLPGMGGAQPQAQRSPMEIDQQRWPELLDAMQRQQAPQTGGELSAMPAQGQGGMQSNPMQQMLMQIFQHQMQKQSQDQAM